MQATGHHPESLPVTSAAGALDVVKKTIQWEGPQGLYKVSCCSLKLELVLQAQATILRIYMGGVM